jgi:hypothetical protein
MMHEPFFRVLSDIEPSHFRNHAAESPRFHLKVPAGTAGIPSAVDRPAPVMNIRCHDEIINREIPVK